MAGSVQRSFHFYYITAYRTSSVMKSSIQANVSLSLNLKNDIALDMRKVREEALHAYRPPRECELQRANRKAMKGIRVGKDFLSSPKNREQVQRHNRNQTLVSHCQCRAILAFDRGLMKLLGHYCQNVMEHTDLSNCEHVENEINNINESFRQTVFHAYSLGTMDGFEDGADDLRAILGRNPSESTWYPYSCVTKVSDELNDNVSPSKFVKLPVYVQSPKERDNGFRHRLSKLLRDVDHIEIQMVKLVKDSLAIVLQNGRLPILPSDPSSKTVLPDQIASLVRLAFALGHFNGYEMGQESVKAVYYHKEVLDENIYVLLNQKRAQTKCLMVDTSHPVRCDCGFCTRCFMGLINNRSEQRKWKADIYDATEQLHSFKNWI